MGGTFLCETEQRRGVEVQHGASQLRSIVVDGYRGAPVARGRGCSTYKEAVQINIAFHLLNCPEVELITKYGFFVFYAIIRMRRGPISDCCCLRLLPIRTFVCVACLI